MIRDRVFSCLIVSPLLFAATSFAGPSVQAHAATKSSGVLGAFTCDQNSQYPDPAKPFAMCAEIEQRGDLLMVIVSAPEQTWCQASAVFSPPIAPVTTLPDGNSLHQVGPGGVLVYSFLGRWYPHHGDHLIASAMCASTPGGMYQLRTVDYQSGETLPASRTPTAK